MTEYIPLHEAKKRLEELADRAIAGEDIVFTRNGKPLVRLAPVDEPGMRESDRVIARALKRPICFGLLKGQVVIPDDFK